MGYKSKIFSHMYILLFSILLQKGSILSKELESQRKPGNKINLRNKEKKVKAKKQEMTWDTTFGLRNK